MGGVAASRLGLWMFDLSVIQKMQVRTLNFCQSKFILQILCFLMVGKLFCQDVVPESDRCVVAGVQNSLQSTMDLMTYVTGIIISNPKVKKTNYFLDLMAYVLKILIPKIKLLFSELDASNLKLTRLYKFPRISGS